MSDARFFTVDAADDHNATLIDDQGSAVKVGKHVLPRGSITGMVLRVPLAEDGTPDWVLATLDSAEGNKRKRKSRELLAELDRTSGEHDGK